MAYSSSLRRHFDGCRWPLPRQDRERLEYRAKTRPVGWTVIEARAALDAMRAGETAAGMREIGAALRAAISKLEVWVARYEPNELECLQCGYHWLCSLPRGKVPKRCQMCGGYADVEGETMIVRVACGR